MIFLDTLIKATLYVILSYQQTIGYNKFMEDHGIFVEMSRQRGSSGLLASSWFN
jgi:hypothetical protein